MTATVTDLFCGAGGSSLGAEAAGARLVMAANHWETAIEVHQAHFPDAGHDCADISQADPRRYPRTDILLASPECTNHSQARGVSRRRQDPSLWDAPDPAAERSRATMWDVVRFAEQMTYTAIVVENVVEATKWVLWPAWYQAMESLGYTATILSHNSMHHGVPQSRDRIYVIWTRNGLHPDLEMEMAVHCPRCDVERTARQAWKPGRRVGRYRQQWTWSCTTCGATCEPTTEPAASIIDWSLDCPRIGDRARPLATATRSRILAGLQRYGWAPITTSGAGNVHERTPGNRARSISEPLPVQQTTATTALATPPGFLFQPAHGGRSLPLTNPHPTVCASDDRHALVVPMRRNGSAAPTSDVVPTVTAGGTHHALLMRNNTGGGEMCTPTDEPARTVTTAGHQSLLIPYDSTGRARSVADVAPTFTTRDRVGLLDPDTVVDDCGFRMLEPYEIAAAMAFPEHYIPRALSKKDQVKLAGNAVTPPAMAWIVGRILQALERAVTVLAISSARTNAELVLDCVQLGYLTRSMAVLDPTYGKGGFWRRWQPDRLVACDLDARRSPVGYPVDFTELPWPRCFDAVVLDGPYKLNGSGGSHESDDRYGVATRGVSWQSRHRLICDGITEAARVIVPGGWLLVKCQDQVCGGAVRWQTREFADHAETLGFHHVDSLHLVGHRPQPEWQTCRRCKGSGHERVRVAPMCSACHGAGQYRPTQQHAARNYSTLLVLRKARA